MDNWISLSNELYRHVWDKFYEDFNFNPSVYSSDWPSFSLPTPYITYKITNYTDEDIDDLERKCVACLKVVTEPDEYLYALDWQHESFHYNPHLGPPRTISFYPDGDYYLFINKDFLWGYLGHPWEHTISIFGVELIHQFEINRPNLFGEIIRSSP
ncbi:hypothetical protein QFZ77_003269 [Paenibacillus sp. V4I3]|uniref:DUF2716 domain-containing protein n=1 Tax=unclassified Paenibacillus TaxID=185978 RepID=UPI00278B5654|nr:MULTISPECIES: DUF2716 domain-containing protein [unclassified Paenibacillus]MDQ0874610.1 hypothetical protein [Paenibacillus sp. V4I3]MDQ0889638.1 hypothetical protein [Paenibacillus sp. V4I9]